MSGQPTAQAKMVNGKKVKVYSLVMITDATKQRILLGLKKRGLCGIFKFRSESRVVMCSKFSRIGIVESTVLNRRCWIDQIESTRLNRLLIKNGQFLIRLILFWLLKIRLCLPDSGHRILWSLERFRALSNSQVLESLWFESFKCLRTLSNSQATKAVEVNKLIIQSISFNHLHHDHRKGFGNGKYNGFGGKSPVGLNFL